MKLGANSIWLAMAVAMLLAAAPGCKKLFGGTNIGDIAADTAAYEGKTVTVSGQVTDSVSVLGYGAYELTDDSGSIWIISDNARSKGAEVEVTGKVQSGVTIMSDRFGVVIKEE